MPNNLPKTVNDQICSYYKETLFCITQLDSALREAHNICGQFMIPVHPLSMQVHEHLRDIESLLIKLVEEYRDDKAR